jgi:hypothetical protein
VEFRNIFSVLDLRQRHTKPLLLQLRQLQPLDPDLEAVDYRHCQ